MTTHIRSIEVYVHNPEIKLTNEAMEALDSLDGKGAYIFAHQGATLLPSSAAESLRVTESPPAAETMERESREQRVKGKQRAEGAPHGKGKQRAEEVTYGKGKQRAEEVPKGKGKQRAEEPPEETVVDEDNLELQGYSEELDNDAIRAAVKEAWEYAQKEGFRVGLQQPPPQVFLQALQEALHRAFRRALEAAEPSLIARLVNPRGQRAVLQIADEVIPALYHQQSRQAALSAVFGVAMQLTRREEYEEAILLDEEGAELESDRETAEEAARLSIEEYERQHPSRRRFSQTVAEQDEPTDGPSQVAQKTVSGNAQVTEHIENVQETSQGTSHLETVAPTSPEVEHIEFAGPCSPEVAHIEDTQKITTERTQRTTETAAPASPEVAHVENIQGTATEIAASTVPEVVQVENVQEVTTETIAPDSPEVSYVENVQEIATDTAAPASPEAAHVECVQEIITDTVVRVPRGTVRTVITGQTSPKVSHTENVQEIATETAAPASPESANVECVQEIITDTVVRVPRGTVRTVTIGQTSPEVSHTENVQEAAASPSPQETEDISELLVLQALKPPSQHVAPTADEPLDTIPEEPVLEDEAADAPTQGRHLQKKSHPEAKSSQPRRRLGKLERARGERGQAQ
jgi:hypothetical protein